MERFRGFKSFLFLILFLPLVVSGEDKTIERKMIDLKLYDIHQSKAKGSDIPVNKYTPITIDGEETPVGCNPLAIARIMNYYKHPKKNVFVYNNSYELIQNSMTDSFARLARDIGIYGDADYTKDGTSVNDKEIINIFEVAGYSIEKLLTLTDTRKDASELYITVKKEIDAGRPLLLSFWYDYMKDGETKRSGHTMVITGYQKIDPDGIAKEDLYIQIAFGQSYSNSDGFYDLNWFQIDGYPEGYENIDLSIEDLTIIGWIKNYVKIFEWSTGLATVTPKENISYALYGKIQIKNSSGNDDYCPSTTEAFDNGGGVYMHFWDNDHKDIQLQNCKGGDIGEFTVFDDGTILKYGFWKTYKTNNLGVNFLGKPLSNERKDLHSTTCQDFEKGVLLYSKGRKILGSFTRFEPIWILYNNKMKNENITCDNFRNYDNIKTIKNCFPDIFDLKDDKYAHAICSIRRRGIINGFPSGKYKPTDPVTRSQLMKIVLLSKYDKYDIDKKIFPEGKELVDYIEYTDMDGNWAYNYVYYGTRLEIIHGNNEKFNPEDPIIFQDASKIIVNALFEKIEGKKDSNGNLADDWYEPFIIYLENKGLEKDKFKIGQEMTRGDIAYIIAKVKGWI